MSKEIKSKIVPKLRFSEFTSDRDWDKKRLEDVINEFIVPMRDKPKELSGDIPWCRIEDFNGMYLSKSKSNQGVTKATVKKMNLKVYPTNTLLVSCSADLGRCAITAVELVTNQTFIGLVPNTDEVSEIFLYYLMINSKCRLAALSSGTTISYLSRQEFERFKIIIPKLAEQQKIASCLSSLDEYITAESEKLEALKAHKKGLMQQLFPAEGERVPKLRFPEFRDSGEWEESALKKITHNVMVGIASAATHAYRKSGILLFRNQNIKDGYLDDKDVLYIDEEYEKAHKNKRLKSGDLLIARTGYPGTACVVPEKYEGSQSFTTLIARPDKKLIDSTFLCLYINSELGQAFFKSTKIGGGQQNVNAGSLVEMPIPNPSIKEQQKIATCLSSLDDLITSQTEKIEALKVHKKGLMQGLFPA